MTKDQAMSLKHYNTVAQNHSFEKRENSQCAKIKNANNWIKHVIITKAIEFHGSL